MLILDEWHKKRGFRMVGYNRIILNGYPEDSKNYWSSLDGSIEVGRPLDLNSHLDADEIGAHALGFNSTSVSVCMIGLPGLFTPRQLATSKIEVNELRHQFELPVSAVVGHYELNPQKSCPGMPMDIYRSYIAEGDNIKELVKPWSANRHANLR